MPNFIVILQAILYGVIEVVTEWPLISSTGHLIILDSFFNLESKYPEFWPFFLAVIQLGAILAVIIRFFKELNLLSFKKTRLERNEVLRTWVK